MKSEFGDRKTVGTMIAETQEEHEKSDSIEVGDLVREFGKQYMSNLFDYIEFGSKHYDKFFINILSRKGKLYNYRAIEVFPYIEPELPLMEPNQDVWEIDCRKQEFNFLWTLPDEAEFDIILAHPEKESEQLIEWINIYKDFKRKSKVVSL